MNADAEHFLHALGRRFTFQTFDDAKRNRHGHGLTRILHGTLADHADTLADLNAKGAGIFVMVNEGDGKGRKADNVRHVRAYFLDLDGAPLEPIKAAPLPPHCIIESSPRRWHAYWWIDSAPPGIFRAVQVALAERFGADRKVCDLPRVMRVPGFLHRKAEPFLTRIIELRDASHIAHADFVRAFGIDSDAPHSATVMRLPTAHKRRTLPNVIPEGERDNALFDWACRLVRKGHDARVVNDRLQKINAERCLPPLDADEVDKIAAHAAGYGSDGWMRIPHELWDSPAFRALALPARMIVLTAFRRFNGANNGNIVLTHADCKDIPGCRDENAFLAHRAQLVASGLLIVSAGPRMTRNGKAPTLYAIPPQFLPSLTGQNTRLAHTGQNTRSLYSSTGYRQKEGKRADDATLQRGTAR